MCTEVTANSNKFQVTRLMRYGQAGEHRLTCHYGGPATW